MKTEQVTTPDFYRHTQITAPSLTEQADTFRRNQQLEERIKALEAELSRLKAEKEATHGR